MSKIVVRFRSIYQLLFAVLISAALIIQFAYGIFIAHGLSVSYVVVYITFFTILSNILVAGVLITEARASIRGTKLSDRFQRVRGLAVFCIIVTGIIYSFFLRGPGGQGAVQDSIPWINSVFHYIMPVVMTLDWVLFPAHIKISWYSILRWVAVTFVYLIYVEVLGFFSGAYPYFFLDPGKLHGYLGVLRACLFFIPFFVVIAAVVIFINRLRLRFR